MTVKVLETSKQSEWLEIAEKRIKIPSGNLRMNYQKDVDLLVIKFSDKDSTYSKYDDKNGVIKNYDANGKLVSMEILDLYGIFAT